MDTQKRNQSKIGQAKCNSLWSAIVERLTFAQYNRYDSMHRGDLSYKTKALIILSGKITRDTETLALAQDLLAIYEQYFETSRLATDAIETKAILGNVSDWE